MHIERTLVLLKPDTVERGLIGQIMTRFEQAGLKIIGLKLAMIDEDFAKRHYTEDVAIRRGENVRRNMIRMLTSGPVVVMAIEGIEAIELVRKLVGPTEPKSAPPGTIRGDFAHVSYGYSDSRDLGIKNLIHASGHKADAESELNLWFAKSELHSYDTVHAKHIFG